MATLLEISSSLLPTRSPTIHAHNHQPISLFHIPNQKNTKTSKKPLSFKVKAAKPPSGVEFPKVEPQFKAPFLGCTRTAEIRNSRAYHKQGNTSSDWSGYWERPGSPSMSSHSKYNTDSSESWINLHKP